MIRYFYHIAVIGAGFLAWSCSSSTKQSGNSTPAPAQTTNNDSTNTSSTDTDTAAVSSDDGSTSLGQAYYTGFDGSTDYSLLMPGFRNYTIADTSVAKIETLNVTLSETTINELIADAKANDPQLDETRFRKQFTRSQKAVKITPLKAGSTTMKAVRPTGAGNGGGPGGGDIWGSADASVKLVVTAYTTAKLQAGQQRYSTDGQGNLKACKSCHETGAEGAPPHELGRIMQISDSQALQWIKTGQTGSRVAKITHTWEFNSATEEAGIVAYVRSRQTHDIEALTKLYFEQQMATFKANPPPTE